MKRISLLVLGVLCPLVVCAGFKPVLPGGIVQTGGGLTLGPGTGQAMAGTGGTATTATLIDPVISGSTVTIDALGNISTPGAMQLTGSDYQGVAFDSNGTFRVKGTNLGSFGGEGLEIIYTSNSTHLGALYAYDRDAGQERPFSIGASGQFFIPGLGSTAVYFGSTTDDTSGATVQVNGPVSATQFITIGATPVADGTYTMGLGTPTTGQNGTITITNGVITAIQEAN